MAHEKPLVLIVDDNEDLRSVYRLGLESAGYSAAVAQDGLEGIELLSSLRPAIVLLDINMPVMDGIEFLEQLSARRLWRPRAVIAMSADPRYALMARQKGAFEFIEKPMKLDYLLSVIARAAVGKLISPELRTIALRERERMFSEDDVRRAAILASFPPPDPGFHKMLADLLLWLSGYFDVPLTLVNLLRGEHLEIFAAHGLPPEYPPGIQLQCERTYCAGLIRTQEALVLKDALLHPLYKSHPVTELGVIFYVSVPIRVEKDLAVGTLCLESVRAAEFFTEDLRLLHFFAEALAAAVRGAAVPLPSPLRLFPHSVFLECPAFVSVLESRIARNGRLPVDDLVGFVAAPIGSELEESVISACQRGSKVGVALGRGAFGICGLGQKAALERLTSAIRAQHPQFAPSFFSVGSEIPPEFVPLVCGEGASPSPDGPAAAERAALLTNRLS